MKVAFLFALTLLAACAKRHSGEPVSAVAVPHPVPAKFIAATDTLLQMRQDLAYYRNEKFSGIVYALFPNGDTLSCTGFLNGLPEGSWRKWQAGRKPAEERFFVNGRKEGRYRVWWENGQPQLDCFFRNGEYEGVFREWNRNGVLIKQFHYREGHEEGRQQLFYDNGAVRANYTIVNGRRYGLLGTKNCVNVSDSIFNRR